MMPFAQNNKSLNARNQNSIWHHWLIQRKYDDGFHEFRFLQLLFVTIMNLKIASAHHPIHNIAGSSLTIKPVNFPTLINLLQRVSVYALSGM